MKFQADLEIWIWRLGNVPYKNLSFAYFSFDDQRLAQYKDKALIISNSY